MPRRHSPSILERLVDLAAYLPWWLAIVLAAAAYLGLHWLVANPAVLPGEFNDPRVLRAAALGQYLLPATFLIHAGLSAIGAWRRKHLGKFQTQAAEPALRNLSWEEFELLLADAFRRRGYRVLEQGKGVSAEDIVLVVRKDAKRYLVQCKTWHTSLVGADVVRKQFAVREREGADGVLIVSSGSFSSEARAFAAGKPIVLMDGVKLRAFLRRPAHSEGPALGEGAAPAGHAPFGRMISQRRTGMQFGTLAGVAGGLLFVAVLAGATLWQGQESEKAPTAEQRLAYSQSPPDQTHRAISKPRRSPGRLAAFESQYIPPDGCQDWRTDSSKNHCAAHYLRAKRAFFGKAAEAGKPSLQSLKVSSPPSS